MWASVALRPTVRLTRNRIAALARPDQAVTQVLGVLATVAWSGLASAAILFLVKRTVGLRASDAHIEEGLDMAAHGERAFTP